MVKPTPNKPRTIPDLPPIAASPETRLVVDQTPKKRHVTPANSRAEASQIAQDRAVEVAPRKVYVFKLERIFGSAVSEIDLGASKAVKNEGDAQAYGEGIGGKPVHDPRKDDPTKDA